MIPSVRFTADESSSGVISADIIDRVSLLFRQKGCVVLENVFTAQFIKELHTAAAAQYQNNIQNDNYQNALEVGDKRYKLTIDLCPPFDQVHFYAHPLIMPIIKKLLGENCIFGACTSVIALSDSQDQGAHRDHPWLYDNVMDTLVPSYGIKMLIPLVELNQVNGGLRVWPGSHIVFDDKAPQIDAADTNCPIGSCLLMDYRLIHSGLPNRSEEVRPILYNNYYRPWFRDYRNFKRQPRLQMSHQTYSALPDEHRSLFDWFEEDCGDGCLY